MSQITINLTDEQEKVLTIVATENGVSAQEYLSNLIYSCINSWGEKIKADIKDGYVKLFDSIPPEKQADAIKAIEQIMLDANAIET